MPKIPIFRNIGESDVLFRPYEWIFVPPVQYLSWSTWGDREIRNEHRVLGSRSRTEHLVKNRRKFFLKAHRFWYQSMRNDVLNPKISIILQSVKRYPCIKPVSFVTYSIYRVFPWCEQFVITSTRLKQFSPNFCHLLSGQWAIMSTKITRIERATKKFIFYPWTKCFKTVKNFQTVIQRRYPARWEKYVGGVNPHNWGEKFIFALRPHYFVFWSNFGISL